MKPLVTVWAVEEAGWQCQEIPGIDLQSLFLEAGFSPSSYLIICSFPPLPSCSLWGQIAICFTSWSSPTDPLRRTLGIKFWLRQHVLSISWLSYSFSCIKKDWIAWYLSRIWCAQGPFNTQYLPVLHISATPANFFSKVSPSTFSSFCKRRLSTVN